MQVGKGRVRREGADVALVGYGAMVSACLTAADMLSQQGVSATVVDARFCKPLDAELLRQARPPRRLAATLSFEHRAHDALHTAAAASAHWTMSRAAAACKGVNHVQTLTTSLTGAVQVCHRARWFAGSCLCGAHEAWGYRQ